MPEALERHQRLAKLHGAQVELFDSLLDSEWAQDDLPDGRARLHVGDHNVRPRLGLGRRRRGGEPAKVDRSIALATG